MYPFDGANVLALTCRLLHRLDRNVTGALVLACTRASASFFGQAFQNGQVKKSYLAVTLGAPFPALGTVCAPLSFEEHQNKSRLSKAADLVQKPSETRYCTLATTAHEHAALVLLQPATGRKHQLRVHCSSVLRRPILGDNLYGPGHPSLLAQVQSQLTRSGLATPGQGLKLHLHSFRVSIPAFEDEPAHVITCPPPDSFCRTLKALAMSRRALEDSDDINLQRTAWALCAAGVRAK
jgi:23S rRNA-/tRNA-specific pseudouridylate synthase